MDALILDFDGVVVDSEPIHWRGFAAVLKRIGVELSWDDYRERYLGFDDHDCFAAVLADHGITTSDRKAGGYDMIPTSASSLMTASTTLWG